MPIAIPQNTGGTVKGGTSKTLSFTNIPASTNTILVSIILLSTTATVTSVTATGVTFQQVARKVGTSTATEIWRGTGMTDKSVTANFGTATMTMHLTELSGVDAAAPIEAAGLGDSATSTAPGSGTVTTALANSAIFAVIGWKSDATSSSGPTNSFTEISGFGTTGGSAASNVTGRYAWRLPGAAGTYSTSYTVTSVDWSGLAIALKEPTTGGTRSTKASASIGVSRTDTLTNGSITAHSLTWDTSVVAGDAVRYDVVVTSMDAGAVFRAELETAPAGSSTYEVRDRVDFTEPMRATFYLPFQAGVGGSARLRLTASVAATTVTTTLVRMVAGDSI